MICLRLYILLDCEICEMIGKVVEMVKKIPFRQIVQIGTEPTTFTYHQSLLLSASGYIRTRNHLKSNL
jgi:hypothetical protein